MKQRKKTWFDWKKEDGTMWNMTCLYLADYRLENRQDEQKWKMFLKKPLLCGLKSPMWWPRQWHRWLDKASNWLSQHQWLTRGYIIYTSLSYDRLISTVIPCLQMGCYNLATGCYHWQQSVIDECEWRMWVAACMREGQRPSLWTFATDRFCSEPPTFPRSRHMPVAYWKDTISGFTFS